MHEFPSNPNNKESFVLDAMDAELRLKPNLSILMLPWLAHGHISPFLQLAKALSTRNFRIFFCSTPVNLDAIKTEVLSSSSSIQLVELHLPTDDLPPHLHTTKGLPPHLMSTLKNAFYMATPNFRSILQTLAPDLLIYDSIQPWAPQAPSSLQIPAINFNTTGASILSRALHGIQNPGSKFPFSSEFTIHNYWRNKYTTADGEALTDEVRKEIQGFLTYLYGSCSVVLVHSFGELEGNYIDYLSVLTNKKVLPIGPLVHEPANQVGEDYSNITNWLDKKEPNSTVFVSYGSEYFPSKAEMEEIAYGLELSKANFIWVVRFPQGDNTSTIEEALPDGFLERVGDKGMVVKDWAPQARILQHSNIGGFVSHCGWNSVMESLKYGVPIIGIPMQLDQPYNARIVEEAGVGVEAKRDPEGRIQREEVGKLIREMVVDKTRESVSNKAKEMSELLSKKGEETIEELAAEISLLCKK